MIKLTFSMELRRHRRLHSVAVAGCADGEVLCLNSDAVMETTQCFARMPRQPVGGWRCVRPFSSSVRRGSLRIFSVLLLFFSVLSRSRCSSLDYVLVSVGSILTTTLPHCNVEGTRQQQQQQQLWTLVRIYFWKMISISVGGVGEECWDGTTTLALFWYCTWICKKDSPSLAFNRRKC